MTSSDTATGAPASTAATTHAGSAIHAGTAIHTGTAVTGAAQQTDSPITAQPGRVLTMTTLTGSTGVSASEPSAAVRSTSVTRQGSRFTVIGSAGTGLQLGLFALLSAVLGAQFASITSWLISTVATNRVHRAVTFDVHGSARNRADQVAAFLTSVTGLAITALVLARIPDAAGVSGLTAIVAVNTVVGAGRFFGLRWWLSGSGRRVVDTITAAPHAFRESCQLRHVSLH